jgi:NADH-quinone oxidoreductase subunit C
MSEESTTIRRLHERFGDRVEVVPSIDMDSVKVRREDIVDVCKFLRNEDDLDYDLMRDLTCVDYIHETPRFEVVYHLYSIYHSHEIRLKVRLEESDPTVDTITSIWIGHPDLRRLLMYPEFEGYPLRKDYPVDKEQPLFEEREETKGVL